MAPNQRDPGKKPLKVYLTREQHLKFSKLAASKGSNMTELVMKYVESSTKHIMLTEDDINLIEGEKNEGHKY